MNDFIIGVAFLIGDLEYKIRKFFILLGKPLILLRRMMLPKENKEIIKLSKRIVNL